MPEGKRAMPSAQYEPRDIGEGFIWGAVATMLGVLAGCALLIRALYPGSMADRIMHPPLQHFPAPQLQSNPARDFADFYRSELQRLGSTGWVDREHGLVHIPIERAMQLIATEGIAGWPTAKPSSTAPDPGAADTSAPADAETVAGSPAPSPASRLPAVRSGGAMR